jgi:hypothetical protein
MRHHRSAATLTILLLLLVAEAVPALAATALAVDSTLTLAADPSVITVGDTVNLSGVLTFVDASSSAGQVISLSRDDDAGTHPLGDVVTTADGSYEFDDVVNVGGLATYQAVFAGSVDYGPSQATDAVTVEKLSTSVAINVSKHAVAFGHSVRVKGHLGKGADKHVLELYAKPDGRQRVLLRRARVNRDGFLSVRYQPSRDTTFVAHYDGDHRHRQGEDATATRVRVITVAKLRRFVDTAGKYRIYRKGSRAPVRVHVAPSHRGFYIHAVLQAYKGGHWKTTDKAKFRLNFSSVANLTIRGAVNINFRARLLLPTHADHLGDASRWLYLRFRKKSSGGGGGGGGGGGSCTPGYSPCLVYHGGADYDCYGGGGNGPYFTKPGVVYAVTGSDPYGLDADNDGRGCE